MFCTRAIAFFILTGILFSPGLVPAIYGADATTDKRAGAAVRKETVWTPDKQTLQALKQKCSDLAGEQLEECLADSMQAFGAGTDAVAFARFLGNGSFVRKFRESGKVDLAWVVYPFRSNDTYGCFIVNGEPTIVDVDDFNLLPKQNMDQDKTYTGLKKSFPKISLWPGDRYHTQYPAVETAVDGGQTIVVPYLLRNFCHSCDVLGTSFFGFDFDKNGKFTGVRFLRVELPVRKAQAKVEAKKESEEVRFVVIAEEGKEFTVRLNSNRTTGYQWHLSSAIDERVVKLAKTEYRPFDTGLAGSGGEEIWTFLAVARGETEITMEYVRPWEKTNRAEKTAMIKVSVRPQK